MRSKFQNLIAGSGSLFHLPRCEVTPCETRLFKGLPLPSVGSCFSSGAARVLPAPTAFLHSSSRFLNFRAFFSC